MLLQYYHTLRYLKPIQWRCRILYTLRNRWRKWTGFRYPAARIPWQVVGVKMIPSVQRPSMWQVENNRMEWLNLPHVFGEKVNWNCSLYGKLWTYNLHYFEYLTCAGVDPSAAEALLLDFVRALPQTPAANEPYPISLRLLFWIRFFSSHQIQNDALDHALYAQAYALLDQRELHLLGNHYLENGFGLLFAAYRYQDAVLYRQAEKILKNELAEQVLADGGHFELSPMYHQIILYRLLDAYNLVDNNPELFAGALKPLLGQKAGLMLGWLQQITFANGDIPLLNDAALGVAPATSALIEYAQRLKIAPIVKPLMESGYRKIDKPGFQVVMDIGKVGPDYIAGHAHSDTLGFELHAKGHPMLVDTGISTYDKNERRQLERATAAHNTVIINEQDQTEVWGGFRVARRAYPIITADGPTCWKATHTGYDAMNVRHWRSFEVKQDVFQILDEIQPYKVAVLPGYTATACFHFHPAVVFIDCGADYIETDLGKIIFEGLLTWELLEYAYSPRFNVRLKAQKAVVHFRDQLLTTIQ